MKPYISYLVPKIIIFLSICAVGYPSNQVLIVNGENSTIEKCPYQVSIRCFGYHICGGVIITTSYVITAAHCLYPWSNSNKHIYTVMAGSTKLYGGKNISITNFTLHMKYSPATNDFDIGLLQLANKLRFDATTNAVKIPPESYQIPDKFAIISGWGQTTEENYVLSTNLQSAKVKIIPHKECETAYWGIAKITNNQVCAGLVKPNKQLVDSCYGDSGGPLVQSGYVIGIVSWGFGCARKGFPGVYTNVGNFQKWIKNQIKQLDL